MTKRHDKRMFFIAQCLNQKLTVSANAANEWYIANNGHKLTTQMALAKYKEQLGRDNEPDLGRMFDDAYDEQCRNACGL